MLPKEKRMLRHTRIAILIAFAATSVFAATATPVHRTFNVASGGTLTIDADVGDIEVTSGSGSAVTVDVTQSSRSSRFMDVTAEQQGNDVVVRGKFEGSQHWFNFNFNGDAKFVVSVPSRYSVQLSTSGGDIRVSDLQGEARVKTSGGGIKLGNIEGTVNAHTSGGDISLGGSRGAADLYTSGGGIDIGDVAGNIQAKTSGGSVDVRRAGGDLYIRSSGGGIEIGEALGTVNAETSGGSIRARLASQPKNDSRMSTSGGGITVSIAPNVSVDVDAHTSGGEVETDVPVTLLGRQNESSIEGKINGGGPKLMLRSSGGDIRIRKL
jgi:DUF4097 and DUF4098 domain-containing protein YvlB